MTEEERDALGRFKPGHVGIYHPRPNYVFTAEHKRKIGEANRRALKEYYRTHPEERARNRRRLGLLARARIGIKRTPETIEKIRRGMAGKVSLNSHRFKKGFDPNRGGYKKGDGIKRGSFQKGYDPNRACPPSGTRIELAVEEELSRRGYAYYTQKNVLGASVDVVFPDQKIAVFCDGDYWHTRFYALKRDAVVNELLQENGWLVLRYWEREIKANVVGVVDEIEDAINEYAGVRASTGTASGTGG